MSEQPIKFQERAAYYAAGGDQQMTSTFNLRMPEIYQLEITNACNFTCDFCPRDNPGMRRKDVFLDLALARTIAERDLGGSYFVEFQLAGEPTLHRDFNAIIEAFRGKVMTGLSTNGSSMHAHRVWQGLLMLDYLTISIDSVEDYERVRPGGKWDNLVRNIDFLLEKKGDALFPAIDLQLIEFPGVERQRDLLLGIAQRRGWDKHVQVRRIPDCFLSVTRQMKESQRKEICLNPWMSVSVQADGDVTSCCFSFGKEIVYGNLRNQSLQEIWETSPELLKFREEHLSGNLRDICSRCYQRSPVMLHWDLYQGAVRERVLNANDAARTLNVQGTTTGRIPSSSDHLMGTALDQQRTLFGPNFADSMKKATDAMTEFGAAVDGVEKLDPKLLADSEGGEV